jgi:hypothetical protein
VIDESMIYITKNDRRELELRAYYGEQDGVVFRAPTVGSKQYSGAELSRKVEVGLRALSERTAGKQLIDKPELTSVKQFKETK